MTIKISKLLQQSSPTSQYLELTRATLSFYFPLLQFPLQLSALCTIAAFYLETICLIVLISQPDSNCNLMRKNHLRDESKKILCKKLLFVWFYCFQTIPWSHSLTAVFDSTTNNNQELKPNFRN